MKGGSYFWHIQTSLKAVKKWNKFLFKRLLVLLWRAVEITKNKLDLLTWFFFPKKQILCPGQI